METPFWLDGLEEVAASSRDSRPVDVAVVGGGVTGCSCAVTLAEAGVRVRVHEARTIASGASGRNGGFALRGGAMPYDRARARFGPERAAAFWRLTERSLARMAELAGDAFRRVGSLRLAAEEQERDDLRAEYEALRADGFDVEWVDELPERLAETHFGAIAHPTDGSLHPARWVRGLAGRAAEAGADLREHARVASLDELEADHVVIASDGYPSGLVPELDELVRPTRGQVVTTEPLAELLYDRPHYARQGFDYWQQLPDRRLVAGGRRDVALDAEYTPEEATTAPVQSALEELVRELVGRVPTITHRWSGIFGTSPDQLPLVGPVPGRAGVWVARGYSGHGNVLGLAAGDLVARAILGRRERDLDLFDPARLL
ncbi:MAG TPA: FAD-dependent oxidoreductase [Gaiellaceae bacterium]|nr:FAD-dependent oxidoreductase [Gaiellaceae bacterium]